MRERPQRRELYGVRGSVIDPSSSTRRFGLPADGLLGSRDRELPADRGAGARGGRVVAARN